MRRAHIAHHFVSAEQQQRAVRLGMWTFLAGEVLLFSGLFTAYTIYRVLHPAAFAEASQHLYASIGITNTVVLLISSCTMALAVHTAEKRRLGATVGLLVTTATLGALFLALKAVEYGLDYREELVPNLTPGGFSILRFEHPRESEMFFVLYFIMTGLHAVHLTVGVALVFGAAALVRMRRLELGEPSPLEPLALYWHLVDVIWVFLLPLLYFAG